jgi:transcriptional regulator with XRE-family HTH domain
MHTSEKLAAFLTEHEITQREFAQEMNVSEGIHRCR